jgi:general secretion pathway protein K
MIRSNRSGVALIFVLAIVATLTTLILQFSFSSAFYRSSANHSVQALQARYAAKSGLRMSLLRISIYQKVKEKIASVPQASRFVSPELIESIWSFPFVFPPPAPPNASLAQQNSRKDWIDSIGTPKGVGFSTFISSQSGKINLNRLLNKPQVVTGSKPSPNNQDQEDGETPEPPTTDPAQDQEADQDKIKFSQERFSEYLQNLIAERIEREREKDDYANLAADWPRARELVEALQAWIIEEREAIGGINQESIYQDQTPPYKPKNGPLWDTSELHMIEGWHIDELAEIFKSEFTAFAPLGINVNEISRDELKSLVQPVYLIEEDTLDFYEERKKDPNNPLNFSKTSDLFNWLTQNAGLDEDMIQTLKEEHQKLGIRLVANESLFEVKSVGRSQEISRSLVAYIRAGEVKASSGQEPPPNQGGSTEQDQVNPSPENQESRTGQDQKIKTLPPRVVYLRWES